MIPVVLTGPEIALCERVWVQYSVRCNVCTSTSAHFETHVSRAAKFFYEEGWRTFQGDDPVSSSICPYCALRSDQTLY